MSNWVARVPRKFLNYSGCCQAYRLLFTNWKQVPIAEDKTYITTQTWRGITGACRAFIPMFECLWFRTVFCILTTLPKEKSKLEVSHKSFDLQWCLAGEICHAVAAQSLWKWATSVWFNLSPTPWDKIHTRHCLGEQEPETRYSRHLWENQLLYFKEGGGNKATPTDILPYS